MSLVFVLHETGPGKFGAKRRWSLTSICKVESGEMPLLSSKATRLPRNPSQSKPSREGSHVIFQGLSSEDKSAAARRPFIAQHERTMKTLSTIKTACETSPATSNLRAL